MPRAIHSWLLATFILLAFTPAEAVTPPEQWQAVSNTASSITGDVTFSVDRIVFQNGKSLPLAPAGSLPVNDVNGRKITATLFKVTRPDDPVLRNGNRLCGGRTPEPVTYIAVWRHAPFGGEANPRDLAVFSGPTPPATADSTCATYSYAAGAPRGRHP